MTVSKTDFSDVFLVARKTQQVASWSRDGVSRAALAILMVTRFNREFRIGIYNNIFICFHY